MAVRKKKNKAKKVGDRRFSTSSGAMPADMEDYYNNRTEELDPEEPPAPRKKTAARSKKAEKLHVPAPEWVTMELVVVSTPGSSLISHAWSTKAKTEMLLKQMKKATQGKQAKDPTQDYLDSLYKHPSGGYGIPANSFKNAGVGACRYLDMAMTMAKGAFHVPGELVQILGDPIPRQDMVRVGMGTADIRFRADFPEWAAVVPVEFNARVMSAEQIVNLFRNAGRSLGVADWRPEKGGNHGMFDVADEVTARKVLKNLKPAKHLTYAAAQEQMEELLGFSLDNLPDAETKPKRAAKKTTKKTAAKKTTKKKAAKVTKKRRTKRGAKLEAA